MVFEGQENSAIQQFWALLGGKTAYMDERVLKSLGETTVPRLFHGSNASGSFKSMCCITYTQGQSQDRDRTLQLVSFYEVFLWGGPMCIMGVGGVDHIIEQSSTNEGLLL